MIIGAGLRTVVGAPVTPSKSGLAPLTRASPSTPAGGGCVSELGAVPRDAAIARDLPQLRRVSEGRRQREQPGRPEGEFDRGKPSVSGGGAPLAFAAVGLTPSELLIGCGVVGTQGIASLPLV